MTKENKELQKKDNTQVSLSSPYIIGVGASAGGLEALNELFDNMPTSPGCAFIVIQHLSPDYKSLLAELLAKHTSMKVSEAEEGMFVRSNNVYIIPTKKNITIKHGKLRLSDKPVSQVPNMAIDIFLKSLAEDKKEKAIGIILSGTGSDGTKGIEAIKNVGGMVIVQDPVTAKFDGMPNSAIYSGNTDLILAPEFIPEGIFNLIKENPGEKTFAMVTEHDEPIINDILQKINQHTGCDFTLYKRPTIIRRIIKRMTHKNINSINDYLNYINTETDEANNLCKEFLIGVTKFFRDAKAFEALRREVLPSILEKKSNAPVKIWVAGCSTGEEAYSIAITIAQYLEVVNKYTEVKIFASDIDKEAIEFASRGVYPSTITKDVPEQILAKYFIREGENYKVIPQIRRMVIFAAHNIIKDPPFSRIDLISCRNLLIYLSSTLQKKVINAFHFALNLNGYLFLGPSENIDAKIGLVDVNKKWKIYKNTKVSSHLGSDLFSPTIYKTGKNGESTTKIVRSSSRLNETYNDTIAEEFNFAGIYVNENGDIIEAVGDFKSFIHLPEKKLHFNLLKMVPEELSFAISTAMRRVLREGQKVTMKRVRVKEGDNSRILSIVAKPEQNQDNKIIFILLGERPSNETEQNSEETIHYSDSEKEKVGQLEEELKETKENLQAAMEELETSNEELQSTVEELLSANEELQSTNEELQSLNEELHTVNTEHELKIKELIELNDDLNNYFRNSEIGQVFLDSNLNIRKFTPSTTHQINLIEGDIGRPISHISHNMKYDNLLDDVKMVMRTSVSIEKEVESTSGKYYQIRILPYIRQDKVADGIVITFVDISTIKNLNNILAGILNSSLNGIMGLKTIKDEKEKIKDFECVLVNESGESVLPGIAIGRKLFQEFPEMKSDGISEKFIAAHNGKPQRFEYYHKHKDSGKWLQLAIVKIAEGVAVTFADITEKKTSEERIFIAYEELKKAESKLKELNNELEQRVDVRTKELAFSEERLRLVSESTNDVIRDWDIVSNEMWWNEGFKTWLGYNKEDGEKGYDSWAQKIHPEDSKQIIDKVNTAINNGDTIWTGEYRFKCANGNFAYIFDRCIILHNENGTPYRMLCSMVDITVLRKAQEELKKSNETLVRINNDLDNFIYTASHDLKAPVSNIEGLVTTLEGELMPKEGEVKMIIELIKSSVNKFKETIKDLTEITKIQKNPVEDTEALNVKDLVSDIELSIMDMIKGSKAEIHVETDSHPIIKFSKKNLKSVIYNLLSNAIKYRSPERKPEIFISTEQQDGYLTLRIKDNGLGVEKDKQGKMFSMFKRFHDHVEGTGVGLYIVKKIVENAGGKIEVESEVNKGTTFTIFFKQ